LSQWFSQCLPDIVSEPPSTEPGAACTQAADGFASLSGGTTGGAGGTIVTVQDQAELEKYAKSAGKYVIKVKGKITISPRGKTIKVTDDKTIIGIDSTGEIASGTPFKFTARLHD
jgi:pectate lyase